MNDALNFNEQRTFGYSVFGLLCICRDEMQQKDDFMPHAIKKNPCPNNAPFIPIECLSFLVPLNQLHNFSFYREDAI